MPKYITEFVGTFLFLFVIALVAPSGHPLTPLAIGGALMVMVYMGGAVSGGHYNPAVTIGLASVKKIAWSEVGPYIVAQLAGAVCAFMLGGFVAKPASIAPAATTSLFGALVIESILTGMLVLTVLNVACSKKTANNSYFGLAIGFVIVCAAAAGGGLSGGAFNPAVGIGATLSGAVYAHKSFDFVWIYLVGPILGGLAAAQVWKAQKSDE